MQFIQIILVTISIINFWTPKNQNQVQIKQVATAVAHQLIIHKINIHTLSVEQHKQKQAKFSIS